MRAHRFLTMSLCAHRYVYFRKYRKRQTIYTGSKTIFSSLLIEELTLFYWPVYPMTDYTEVKVFELLITLYMYMPLCSNISVLL